MTQGEGEHSTGADWLRPESATIAALTRLHPMQNWDCLQRDPALLLLIANHLHHRVTPGTLTEAIADILDSDHLLRRIEAQLDQPSDSLQPSTLERMQRRLDLATACSKILAWNDGPAIRFAAGLMEIGLYFVDDREIPSSIELQVEKWGLHLGEIHRRLARRNHWPVWLREALSRWMLPTRPADANPVLQALRVVDELDRALQQGSLPAEIINKCNLSPEQFRKIVIMIGELKFRRPAANPGLRPWLAAALETRQQARTNISDEEMDLLERQVAQPKSYLDEADLRNQKLRSLAEFAGGASHEINNPLAIISGHAQYLLNHTEEEKWQKALWAIIRQTERVHAILNDVMRFARPGLLHEESVDVGEVLQQLVNEYKPVAEPKRISLSSQAGQALFIKADRAQLKHGLGCLLVNSIEAIVSNGWAKFDTTIDANGALTIAIEDSGPGIPASQIDHIFDPFFSGRSAGRGKGLGLSIAWRVADLHGGSIRYSPKPNGPTRFEIELPSDRLQNSLGRMSA
ncbi:HAMP domain-containing histidine kinase [Telmatocola sphagniphila]|uniref:histidine kinase n=1 Tax=Telmatocola sphagniphila TaxID=1123043 RepID=A0A8E6B8U7_9BACT|nr:HAMP domain-containing sensor histidine kinase [Telmatocola sphagniphila]QVL32525.1 HAMP domain-containing histidine kinase [Telmatocola sphagniphila]